MPSTSIPDAPAHTTTQRVYLVLRGDMERGVLAPGAALDLAQLASRFGVSKIPVREALRQLDAEGLVQLHPRRPATVRALEGPALEELYDLRLLLEVAALKYAVPGYSATHRETLRRTLGGLLTERDPLAWAECDARLHRLLYEPAARPRLLAWIEQLRRDVDRYLATHPMVTPDVMERQNAEMRVLVGAAVAGQTAEAAAALRLHLRGAMRVFLRGIQGRVGAGQDRNESRLTAPLPGVPDQ